MVDVSKYLYLYRGPATPMEDFTPEQGAELQAAWTSWMEAVGPAMVEFGNPFGARTAVADDGTTRAPGDLNGYSIVEADTLDAADGADREAPVPVRGQGQVRDRGVRARPDVTAQAPAGSSAPAPRRVCRWWRRPSTVRTTSAAQTSTKPTSLEAGIGSW